MEKVKEKWKWKINHASQNGPLEQNVLNKGNVSHEWLYMH